MYSLEDELSANASRKRIESYTHLAKGTLALRIANLFDQIPPPPLTDYSTARNAGLGPSSFDIATQASYQASPAFLTHDTRMPYEDLMNHTWRSNATLRLRFFLSGVIARGHLSRNTDAAFNLSNASSGLKHDRSDLREKLCTYQVSRF